MKKFLLLLPVLMLYGVFAPAQIIINNTDMPVAGDTLRMSTGLAFQGMSATQTGANHIWDFSKLTSVAQTVDTFVSLLSTDPAYILVFNAFGKNKSNLAERGFTFGAAGFTVSKVFNFYNNTSSRFEQTGFGAYINGIPAAIAYSPHDTIYRFPLTYGLLDSSRSGYIFKLPTLFYFGSKSVRHNEVDGWGSLTTPYGTFDVLRVKTTIISNDSLYIDTLGTGIGINSLEQTQYKWLGKGEGRPLLQINTSGGIVTQIIYRDSIRAGLNIGVKNQDVLSYGPVVFPNPSGTVQSIIYSITEAADIRIDVFDMTGKKVATLVDERQVANKYIYTFDIKDEKFPTGTYMLNISVNGNNHIEKLIVTK